MLFWLAIFSTITVLGLTEGSSCCCDIVYHYCLRFYRGVVHVVFEILYTITT